MKIRNLIYNYIGIIVIAIFLIVSFIYMFCDNCELIANVMMTFFFVGLFLFTYKEDTILDFIKGMYVKLFFGFTVFAFLLVQINFLNTSFVIVIYTISASVLVERVQYILQTEAIEKAIQKQMKDKDKSQEIK